MTDIIRRVEKFLEGMTYEEVEALLEKYGNSDGLRGSMYMSREEYLFELEQEIMVETKHYSMEKHNIKKEGDSNNELSFKITNTYAGLQPSYFLYNVNNNEAT
jgi:hypothetical protein